MLELGTGKYSLDSEILKQHQLLVVHQSGHFRQIDHHLRGDRHRHLWDREGRDERCG